MRTVSAIALLAIALLIAGCGDSDSSGETTQESAPAKEAAAEPLYEKRIGPEGEKWLRAAAAATAAGKSDPRWAKLERAAGPDAKRLILPGGAPPEEVVFKDLRVGKGAALEPGDHFGAGYTSYDYKSGQVQQRSPSNGSALFAYGEGELVKAWEPGLRGMRVGGVREIIAPGSWVYGSPTVYLLKLTAVEKEE